MTATTLMPTASRLSLPMRDGNSRTYNYCMTGLCRLSLPMRDGNYSRRDMKSPNSSLSLPMRDGNNVPNNKPHAGSDVLAYL